MAKNVKSSAVKRSIELASLGAFEEARKPMGKEFTEDVFLANITVGRYNTNLFNFVQEFKNPDWHTYVKSMNAKTAPDFFHLAKKNNIDLLQQNSDGKTIVDVILGNCSFPDQGIILEALDADVVVKAFLDQKTSQRILRWFNNALYYSQNHYNNYKESEPSTVDTIINKINTPEVLVSENYKKLFEEKGGIIDYLINHATVSGISNLINKNPNFFGEYAKVIMDTKLIKKLHHPNSIDKNLEEAFEKVLEEKSFKPNLNFLDDGWKGAIVSGNFNMQIDSKEYLTLKKLLANGLLETEKYNNPDERYYTVFERFLVANLENARFSPTDIPKVLEIIEEAEKLSQLGIEKKCVMKSSEGINELLENAFKRNNRFSVDADIDELAWKLRLPPPLLQDLVDFFDKRYNYSPENKNGVDPEKEKMQQAWNNLMSQITFTKDLQQEKKTIVKP
jgi:hypothetical protein